MFLLKKSISYSSFLMFFCDRFLNLVQFQQKQVYVFIKIPSISIGLFYFTFLLISGSIVLNFSA